MDNWKHRASNMRCATCMFFVPKEPTENVGRCRRHAPTMGGFPVVYDNDWCGDHKLDENRVPQVKPPEEAEWKLALSSDDPRNWTTV